MPTIFLAMIGQSFCVASAVCCPGQGFPLAVSGRRRDASGFPDSECRELFPRTALTILRMGLDRRCERLARGAAQAVEGDQKVDRSNMLRR